MFGMLELNDECQLVVNFENLYYYETARKRFILQFDPLELLGITNYALPIRSFDWCDFPMLFLVTLSFFMFFCLAWLSWWSSSVCKVHTLGFFFFNFLCGEIFCDFQICNSEKGFSSPSSLTAHFYNML